MKQHYGVGAVVSILLTRQQFKRNEDNEDTVQIFFDDVARLATQIEMRYPNIVIDMYGLNDIHLWCNVYDFKHSIKENYIEIPKDKIGLIHKRHKVKILI